MKKWQTLYKKTSTGAIQFWTIEAQEAGFASNEPYSIGHITTTYGQLDTESPQTTIDVIREGKNIGKKNATTAIEQAIAEAQAKWEKQKKKGYVESIEAAQADELDELIEGGIVPMLAQSFAKHAAKIKYPCYGQPKLDGIRCIAILKDGKCTLWSRTRKLITGVPHIAREIEQMYGKLDITLDGELYNHSLKKDFEKIVSMVRQEEPQPGHEVVQYHVYDIVNEHGFEQRFFNFFGRLPLSFDEPKYIRPVETKLLNSEDEIPSLFEYYTSWGYEGLMLRNKDSKYANKRSYDLQKVKEFEDAEFDIIGIEEGRGKLAGHVGAFVLRDKSGQEFLAKMSGETSKLKEYFENDALWKGQKLTVQFQGLTAYGIPRFPVGLRIRIPE